MYRIPSLLAVRDLRFFNESNGGGAGGGFAAPRTPNGTVFIRKSLKQKPAEAGDFTPMCNLLATSVALGEAISLINDVLPKLPWMPLQGEARHGEIDSRSWRAKALH